MTRFDEPIALRHRPPLLRRMLRVGFIASVALTVGLLVISLFVAITAQR